jgi:DNA-binding CsgD family transcriptional regulator
LLELGLGREEAAVVELERLHGSGLVFGEPMIVLWLPDLIEAYIRAGMGVKASESLEVLEEQVRDRGRAGALAATERCRGLLAERGEFEQHFARALEWHAATPTPFERARTELCLGERLRRGRRGAEAKPYLLAALGTFERLGALPWAERTRRELGGRKEASGGLGSLTSHEREVAALVARGATNREAAAALFVSPKTIEYHLASAYRKLDVRSRTELALAVRDRLGAGST